MTSLKEQSLMKRVGPTININAHKNWLKKVVVTAVSYHLQKLPKYSNKSRIKKEYQNTKTATAKKTQNSISPISSTSKS